MLFKNQYTMLKKANDMSADTLNTENRTALKEITCCLLYMTWNCYEIERIRKDLIDMAARCELDGRTLREEIGGDTARYLLELAPDLPRGTPLDYVCIWYPRWYGIFIPLYLLMALLPGSRPLNLMQILVGPFRFMIFLAIWGWFRRKELKIKIRYGCIAQVLWFLLMLAVFWATSVPLSSHIIQHFPGTISGLGATLYELLWVIVCQLWQNFYYNRCAARHPWQASPPILSHSLYKHTPKQNARCVLAQRAFCLEYVL